MKISLDWDNTVTRDPQTWAALVSLMTQAGWDVRIVTLRPADNQTLYHGWSNENINQWAAERNLPVIYTNGRCKRELFDADIFIDDMPAMCATHLELLRALHPSL
jgi:hypothetical protein